MKRQRYQLENCGFAAPMRVQIIETAGLRGDAIFAQKKGGPST
jgi:hypothetical protein